MMGELWTKKRVLGYENENNIEYTSNYKEPGVQLARFGLDDVVSVIFDINLGLVPAASWMVN
jgi:hypothetical protein